MLTPGHRHEQTAFRELMRRGAVKRPGRGRPKLRPRTIVGDKGYTGRPVRDHLRRHGIGAVIPQLKTEKTPRLMDRALYRERNVVERLVGRLKEYRRIATRCDKLAGALDAARAAAVGPGIEGVAGLKEQKTHTLSHLWLATGQVVLTYRARPSIASSVQKTAMSRRVNWDA